MNPSLNADGITERMELMIRELRSEIKANTELAEPPELTDALEGVEAQRQKPLPIPDSVLRELIAAHLDQAADDIMRGFEQAIERMNEGLRQALEDHLSLTRRQMRESLREVLLKITRLPKNSR